MSTGAKIDPKSIQERPCFLCEQNRPKEQVKKIIDGQYELLVNPYPILPQHFTIPSVKHQPQRIINCYSEIHKLLEEYPEMMGPQHPTMRISRLARVAYCLCRWPGNGSHATCR